MTDPPVVTGWESSGALRVLLNRPERRNAVDERTLTALLSLLDEHPDVPLLLGSTDPTVFCAGADLAISDAERARCSDLLYQCYERFVHRSGVVLAVIEGAAVGGGAQLSTAADLRIASPTARWRWVGPGHGLAVGAWILPSLLGRTRALELTLSGRWLDVIEAADAGLVSRTTEQPWQQARGLVEHIVGLDDAAVARVKSITAMRGIERSLTAEREANHASWAGAID